MKSIYEGLVKKIKNYQDIRLSRKIIARLYSLDKEEWIPAEHDFNEWKFPMKFYDLMPKWWINEFGKEWMERAYKITYPLIDIVKKEFGIKETLRYHNVCVGKMTNDEFEYWFSLSGEDVTKYYRKRVKIEKLRWWEEDVFEKMFAN